MAQDPSGTRFAFEMGAAKTSGGSGWADVAKLGYFGWEYNGSPLLMYGFSSATGSILRLRPCFFREIGCPTSYGGALEE